MKLTTFAAHAALASLSSLTLATGASAQTVTVTLCADTIDVNPSTATVADLPGPDGEVSLSEALIASNNTPGRQTIEFAIPTSNWQLQFIYPGRAVVNSSIGFYWRAYDEVTIDASTQTAFTGDTNPDGGEVVLYGSTLYLNADNCIFTGFDSSSVSATQSNALIEGNTGTTNIDVFGGSGSTIRGNKGGTIKIDRSNNNVVVGNTIQRIRIWGFGVGQPALGNRIGGPDPADRNFITGYGTWNSDGLPAGHCMEIFDNDGTIIENNWIGTTPDGMAQGNLACNMGLRLLGSTRNLMVRNNLIAGIRAVGQGPHHAGQLFGWAVYFDSGVSDVTLVGNTIGLDASGAPTLGSVWGLDVGDSSRGPVTNITVGDTGPGEGNVIAGHIFNGVTVGLRASGVRLAGNSIRDNGWLGIDLVPTGFGYGVSANDPLDADTGGNGMQNFPVLATAVDQGGMTRVTGSLQSEPLRTYTLEFFASSACDPSGFGEGQVPLGTASVITDSFGDASFDVLLGAAVASGWFVTATATEDSVGSTSEFSGCIAVTGSTCQSDIGFGGPGLGTLSLCGGDLSTGTTADLALRNAAPNQPAVLVVGPTNNPTSLFGGTIVPVLPNIVNVYTTNGAGEVTIPGVAGGGGPLTMYAQFLYVDPAQSLGWGFSNALQVEFLP